MEGTFIGVEGNEVSIVYVLSLFEMVSVSSLGIFCLSVLLLF